MPTTPGCQSRPSSTSPTISLSICCSACCTASTTAVFSSSRRLLLACSRASANSSASLLSRHASSRAAISGFPSLPAALSRGASRKEMSSEVTTVPSVMPACWQRAQTPGLFLAEITSRPALTNILFTPTRSITSATVPRATRSRYFFKFGTFCLSQKPFSTILRRTAMARKKTTPTPDNPLNGKSHPFCFGLIIASACGIFCGGSW